MEIYQEYLKTEPYPLKGNSNTSEIDRRNIIYLMRNPLNSLYKIGITFDVNQRVRQISSQSGIAIDLIAYAESDPVIDEPAIKVESFLHKYFKSKRKIGEWFELNKRDLVELRHFIYEVDFEVSL